MSTKFLAVLILFSGLLVFSVNDSYADVFLKIGDIKGESTDNDHGEWIELLSFTQSINDSVSSEGANSFEISKNIDKSTPKFVEAITKGTIFSEAVIDVCDRTCYKKIVLKNVMISSYAISGSGDSISQEVISFVFEEISEKEAFDEPTFEPDLEPKVIPPTSDDEESLPPEIDTKIEQKLEKKQVPDWIKTNARWWSEGQIGDSDFVGGIQYMIKEKIINIPDLPEEVTQMELKDEKRAMGMEREQNVPDWVRNNAGWWADGLISDEDFVSGIKYLIEQGIIRV